MNITTRIPVISIEQPMAVTVRSANAPDEVTPTGGAAPGGDPVQLSELARALETLKGMRHAAPAEIAKLMADIIQQGLPNTLFDFGRRDGLAALLARVEGLNSEKIAPGAVIVESGAGLAGAATDLEEAAAAQPRTSANAAPTGFANRLAVEVFDAIFQSRAAGPQATGDGLLDASQPIGDDAPVIAGGGGNVDEGESPRPQIPFVNQLLERAGQGFRQVLGEITGNLMQVAHPASTPAGELATAQIIETNPSPPSNPAPAEGQATASQRGAAISTGAHELPTSATMRQFAQALAASLGGFIVQNQKLSASLFNRDFLDQGNQWARQLLDAAGELPGARLQSPAAQSVPRESAPPAGASAPGGGNDELADDALQRLGDKLGLMLELLARLDESATGAGREQVKRLARFLGELQRALGGQGSSDELATTRAGVATRTREGNLRAALEQGFAFKIEIREATRVEAAVTRLRAGGIDATTTEIEQERMTRLRVAIGGQKRNDPIVLDLNRDGVIDLKNLDVPGARAFDINADGRLDRAPFGAGGDASLALDRDGNGTTDSGRELFGDRHGAKHGMEELARFDVNRDWQINYQDPIFTRLVAFHDMHRDGIVRGDDFKPLAGLGVKRLLLDYKPIEIIRPDQNILSAASRREFEDGGEAQIIDVELILE